MALWEKIQEKKAYLDRLPSLSNGSLARLDEDFSLLYNYNSNAIEGSTLTEMETRLVIKEGVGIDGKSTKDQIAAVGHQKAYEYIRQQLKENPMILSEDLIKKVHAFVLMGEPEDAGQYRTVSVRIGNADVILPSADAVPGRMARLIEQYHTASEDYPVVRTIAWMHLEFESIHPFVDGNGRTGRLILNYELMRMGYPPIDIKRTDAARYYDCFRSYQGPDETPIPMEYMVGEYVLAAIVERIEQVEETLRIRSEREEELEP
ncbi:Fic family protein [Eubacteriales bacterium OttesenSCG-928-M02]|nr:Fic family protein [Eubacteriales bacterium OttesenSCG-928-M02]